jgi:hypothetical protein
MKASSVPAVSEEVAVPLAPLTVPAGRFRLLDVNKMHSAVILLAALRMFETRAHDADASEARLLARRIEARMPGGAE